MGINCQEKRKKPPGTIYINYYTNCMVAVEP